MQDIFQPQNLNEFIGQKGTKELLSIAIGAAKIERRKLPNILIVGGFGLGKSSLATLVHKEYGISKPQIYDGAAVNKNPPKKGTIIIDEAHNIDPSVCDTLNLALDRGDLSITAVTTDPGKLPAAFRSRFRQFNLENYSVQDLLQIGKLVCLRRYVTAQDSILTYIAQRSRGNARQLIMYLATMFDDMVVKGRYLLDQPFADLTFSRLGVDKEGFLERDRRYVNALPGDRPVGITYLMAVLNLDKDTIENEIEPFLLQKGVIDRTQRGRVKIRSI